MVARMRSWSGVSRPPPRPGTGRLADSYLQAIASSPTRIGLPVPGACMIQSLRNNHIERLAEAMRVIGPGATFERFGAVFMDHYLGVPLSHRGLNVLGNPVGGTIDTKDDMGDIAAEYSGDKDYFTGKMDKPTGDLEHVHKLHPKAKDIFLLSSQRAPTGKIEAFVEQNKSKPKLRDKNIHLYDSRRIAEIIVDHLLISDTAIEALGIFLPVLRHIRDEFAASHTVPEPDNRHVSRLEVEAELDRRLASGTRRIAIWGIGGSGKSDAAAAFVASKRANYELSIWLKGSDLVGLEDLRAAPLLRGGEARNIAGLLKGRRCLLVIDDLSTDFPVGELAALCGPGSHILVTCRAEVVDGYQLPMMTSAEARALLEQGLTFCCPEPVFGTIWETVGGHPLSIGLLNKAVSEGATWDDVAADCAAVGQLQDGDQRLADRILGRLHATLGQELTVFSWAGQARCDRRFLREVLLPVGLRKVDHNGLTTVDRVSTVRLHDIVFASLLGQDWLTDARSAELDNALERYIAAVAREDGLALHLLAMTMKRKLEALLRSGERRSAYQVALLEIWEPGDVDPALLPDPVAAARALGGRRGSEAVTDVTAIIETVEGLYRHEKQTLGLEQAKARLEDRLVTFDILAANRGMSHRQLAEIDHHRAKALNILGQRDAARDLFESVLAGPSPLHASRLQLIRIYAREVGKADRAAQLASEILGAPSEEVSNSVLLAAVEALPWGQGKWRDRLMADHAVTIEGAIRDAAAAGVEQAYQTFASVGRHWIWHDPNRFVKVLRDLPARTPADVSHDQDRFAYGEILQQAAKAAGDRTIRVHALAFFEAIETPNDFMLQKHGQLVIEMGRASDAIVILEKISKPTLWSRYWLSKARLDLGEVNEALALIDAAIAGVTPPTQKYRSSFLAHRFEVRLKLVDENAGQDLRDAIEACDDPKYRAVLEARLASETISVDRE
jgi:hypothetical protein